MERMHIEITSLDQQEAIAYARAVAIAENARIHIAVTFRAPPNFCRAELWDAARGEVLRYLDPM